MNSRHIAFATYERAPALTADDRLAADALAERGVRVFPAVWSDPSVDWRRFEAVILRSTWDYHRRPAEFRAWLDRLEAENVVLWNPVPLARWNSDKRYLRDLAARGVPVVPTVWLSPSDDADVTAILDERGWREAVLKPVIAATAYRTAVLRRGEPVGETVRDVLTHGEAMLQPFLPQVRSDGEWSLVFLGGAFSHAVLKRPVAGDFRVQAEFGGTAELGDAPPDVRAAAAAILERVTEPWMYARVDGVRAGTGEFLLMELEMLEPSLFLSLERRAPVRFAEATIARLAR